MYSGNQSKRVYFIIRNFETLNWFCFCSLLLRCLIVVAEYYKFQKLNTTIWEPPIRYCHYLQPTANCRHLFWWFNTRSKLAKQTSLFIKRYISTKILYGVGWRSRSSYKDIQYILYRGKYTYMHNEYLPSYIANTMDVHLHEKQSSVTRSYYHSQTVVSFGHLEHFISVPKLMVLIQFIRIYCSISDRIQTQWIHNIWF